MQINKCLLIPIASTKFMLELSSTSTQCTHGAAVKLFLQVKDIGNYLTPSLVAKWVNGSSCPSYSGDAHGQGDHPLLEIVYNLV